jgi:hypothetical protein
MPSLGENCLLLLAGNWTSVFVRAPQADAVAAWGLWAFAAGTVTFLLFGFSLHVNKAVV